MTKRRDIPVGEEVYKPAALCTAEAVTPFVVDIIIGAPVALTRTSTGHLQPGFVCDTALYGLQGSESCRRQVTLLSTRMDYREE